MRTYDRVLGGVVAPFDPNRWPRQAAVWSAAYLAGGIDERRGDLPAVEAAPVGSARPVIVADDVAATYRESDGSAVEDFHCLAPPWPNFWIEYPSASGHQRRGIHMTDVTAMPRAAGGSLQGAVDDARGNGHDGPIGWLLDCALLIEDAAHRCVGPVGWVVLALDERGRCVGNRWVIATARGAEVVDSVRRLDTGALVDDGWLLAAAAPAFQALALLHCRNVTLDRHAPPEQLDRKHRRRHGRPLVDWRTLRLDVPRRAGGGQRGAGEAGLRGVHVVAGNFHHYGDCCPGVHEEHGRLFGKLTGVYWVPGHARGSPGRGIVMTDWDLRAGEAS